MRVSWNSDRDDDGMAHAGLNSLTSRDDKYSHHLIANQVRGYHINLYLNLYDNPLLDWQSNDVSAYHHVM